MGKKRKRGNKRIWTQCVGPGATKHTTKEEQGETMCIPTKRVASQFFLVSPRDHFVCPVPSFSEMKEIG